MPEEILIFVSTRAFDVGVPAIGKRKTYKDRRKIFREATRNIEDEESPADDDKGSYWEHFHVCDEHDKESGLVSCAVHALALIEEKRRSSSKRIGRRPRE
jgi:ribosomal protein S26